MTDEKLTRMGAQRRHLDLSTRTAPLHVVSLALSDAVLRALPRHVLPPAARLRSIALGQLPDEPLTGPEAPALILSPLLTPQFDALDLAEILSERGFRGRYLALVARLPSANLVRREVALQSPDLNFDVVVLDGSPPLHTL